MKKYSLLAGLLLLAGLAVSQEQPPEKISITTVILPTGTKATLSSMGYMRIKYKDGSVKVKCTIKEFTSCCIVFIKDKVLHDVMTDKIRYIDSEENSIRIYFDEKNMPIVTNEG